MDAKERNFFEYKRWVYPLPNIGRTCIGKWKITGRIWILFATKKTMRLDWDEKRGPHINVTVRTPNTKDNVQNTIRFNGTKELAVSLLKCKNTPESIKLALTRLKNNHLCVQEYGRLIAQFPQYIDLH